VFFFFVGSQVLLPEGNSGQSRRPEAGLPVCRRSQRHRRDRLFRRMRIVLKPENGQRPRDYNIYIYICDVVISVIAVDVYYNIVSNHLSGAEPSSPVPVVTILLLLFFIIFNVIAVAVYVWVIRFDLRA